MSDAKILKHDPLSETEAILRQDFYGEGEERVARRPQQARPRPTHYKVVCISLYTKDIEALESTVADLKRRGYTGELSRSSIDRSRSTLTTTSLIVSPRSRLSK